MKTRFTKFALALAAMAIALVAAPRAHAQQYGSGAAYKQLLNIQGTNVAGAVTNVGNIGGANTNYVTLTKYDSFDLEVLTGLTNASAGSIDVNWTTSDDGINWANTGAGAFGWFSVPLTNGGTAAVWRTNIQNVTYGYYKITSITNNAVQHTTNQVIRARMKPVRQG